jgi:hypothetical protein
MQGAGKRRHASVLQPAIMVFVAGIASYQVRRLLHRKHGNAHAWLPSHAASIAISDAAPRHATA